MIPKTKKNSTKTKTVPLFVLGTDSAIIEKKKDLEERLKY